MTLFNYFHNYDILEKILKNKRNNKKIYIHTLKYKNKYIYIYM